MFLYDQQLADCLGDRSNMKRNMLARQEVMSREPSEAARLRRIKRCRFGQRCNQPECYNCAVPPGKGKRGRTATHHDYRPVYDDWLPRDEAPSYYDLPKEVKPIRIFRNRNAEWMTFPFQGYPEDEIFAVTINHALPLLAANLSEVARKSRLQLIEILKSEFPDAICRGQFEYTLRWVDELTVMFPSNELKKFVDQGKVAHVRAPLFHSHLILKVEGHSKEKIRKKLQKHYPGVKRVCIQGITATTKDEDGMERGGQWGWAQYASKEWAKVDFGSENISAFEEVLALNRTWNRNVMKIKFGGTSKTDLIQRWKVEAPPSFVEVFAEITDQEGWADPDHPDFHLLINSPSDNSMPEETDYLLFDELAIEAPRDGASSSGMTKLENDTGEDVESRSDSETSCSSVKISKDIEKTQYYSIWRTFFLFLFAFCKIEITIGEVRLCFDKYHIVTNYMAKFWERISYMYMIKRQKNFHLRKLFASVMKKGRPP
ncbi:hypothetical protein KHP62_16420 [Rhodobacteraceae bacterium NNCM2]|nr:hypothetical protein [Coraliihabitans acroporae]